MKVLVTGATGYIGSHTCKILHERGHEVHGLDFNDNQNDISKWVTRFIHADVLEILLTERYDAIVHLAGLISVEESTRLPTSYYITNIMGTLEMLCKMTEDTHFIFASTAAAFDIKSPYAMSKLAAEQIIREQAKNYTIFRFFNVAGSDGENRQFGEPTHLVRIAAEVASMKRSLMYVYGTNYDTPDGTCIRDYIHVVDLATAVAIAVEKGPANTPYECIGSGKGYSVWEVIRTMSKVTGNPIMAIQDDRREGDAERLVVDNKYESLLIKHNLEDICRSAYEIELKTSLQ